MAQNILTETIDQLYTLLGDEINSLTVERVSIGIFYTGVKLSNGEGGLCFTPIKSIPEAVCCPSSARVMPASGKLAGRNISYFLENLFAESPMKKALGIAVVNALSSTYWHLEPPKDYTINIGGDPLDDVCFPDDANVAVIGALVPYIKRLKKRGKPFSILELDARTLKPDEIKYHVPPEKTDEVIASADYLISTGTTLINNTLDDILAKTKKDCKVFVVGPTATMLPDAFFRRNVTALGGTAVTKPDALLDMLAEAGSGYHFYGKSAEKVVIKKN